MKASVRPAAHEPWPLKPSRSEGTFGGVLPSPLRTFVYNDQVTKSLGCAVNLHHLVMKRIHRTLVAAVATCAVFSLLATPAMATESSPDDVPPPLTNAEMQAFVDSEPGSEYPDEWTVDASASFVVTEQMATTDPMARSNPYDSRTGITPTDPTVVGADPVASSSLENGTTAAVSPNRAPTPINCRASQDYPHRSHTIARRINTHMIGSCPVTPVFHSLAGATYRQMWYGWLLQTAVVDVTSKAYMKVNVAFRCAPGTYDRYRTYGRFYALHTNGYKSVSYRDSYAFAECR